VESKGKLPALLSRGETHLTIHDLERGRERGGKMNKSQLADAIVKDAGITKAQAMSAVDSVVANITKALKAKDKVVLVGFGTFATSTRAAREGRNPLTGAPLKIPARKVAKFVPGKALKDAIN